MVRRPLLSHSLTRVLVASALSLLVLVSPSMGADDWIEVTTPNFVVLSNAGKGTARDVGREFEQVRHVVRLLCPWARREPGRPFVIFALRRERDMKALAPQYWEDGQHGVSELSASGAGNDYVALDTDIHLSDTPSSNPYFFAYWGYASNVIEYSFPGRLPPWFQRGLADLLANTVVQEHEVHIGRAISRHRRRLEEVGRISASELFAAGWDSKYLRDENWRRNFDAQSWATVHYLLFGDEGAHRPRLDSFIGMVLQGQPARVAEREAFGNLEVLTDPVIRYATGRVLPYVIVEAKLELQDKDFPVRELSPAEALAHRAAFHVATRRPEEARARIEESRQADPKAVFATEVEGLLLDQDGKDAEALPAYERAADGGSQNYWVHYRRALLLRQRDALKETRAQAAESLRRAVELNPEHARSLAALARVLSDLEQGEEAVTAARRAVELEPMEASHHLALTRALWAAGQREDAQREAQVALRIPANDRVRKDARQWLDFIQKRLAAETGAESASTAGGPLNISDAEAACTSGVAPACGALAQAYLAGNGVTQQTDRAVELLDKACQLGDMRGCAQLAHLHFEGRAIPEDQEAAARLATRSCDGGSATGCAVLALVHMKRNTPEDRSRAFELLKQACEDGEAQACQLQTALSGNP